MIFRSVRKSSLYLRPALKLTSNGRRYFSTYSELTSKILIVMCPCKRLCTPIQPMGNQLRHRQTGYSFDMVIYICMSFSLLPYLTLLFHFTTMRYFWSGDIGRKYQKERFFGIDLLLMCKASLYYVLAISGFSKIKIALVWIKSMVQDGFLPRTYVDPSAVRNVSLTNKSKLSPYPLLLTVWAKPSTFFVGRQRGRI